MFLVSKRLIGKTVIAGALMPALGTGTALAQSRLVKRSLFAHANS